MKKQYTSPQFDYWCYISGKLCNAGVALYATADPGTPEGGFVQSSGNSGERF